VLPAGAAAGSSDADPFFLSFAGRVPPGLPRRASWVNAARQESLETLRGRVVLLDFSFLGCGACALLNPHLVEWHRRYAEKGLTIVYVDNGRSDTLEALQAWHVDHEIPFALLHDRLGRAILDYGVRAFPTVYLLGRDGRVVWEGVATGLESSLESAIVQALR
jgi:thiol-disulfide isomerase/thioredoxin